MMTGLLKAGALTAALLLCGGSAAPQPNLAPLEGAGWELVWADEFAGDSLDRTKWTPEVSCWGGGNWERQCYTDRPENIAVEGGLLLLKAKKERFSGPARPPEIAENPNPRMSQPYTSGKVRTIGLHAWRYGRIEVRAKVPAGQGTWPAVWMMPNQPVYGGWPRSGEIDILEAVNIGARCRKCEGGRGENRTISALHFGDYAPNNLFVDSRAALPDLALPSDDFHVYAVEWSEGLIRFLVDDRVHLTVSAEAWTTASPLARGNPAAPFDQPFYIMANLAVGGRLAEENNAKGVAAKSFPAQFAIDWIRVYRCGRDPETGRACMR
ncbi:family 16 glycosylhydrolase [Erythrobacter dokdonensis]|uniref:Glucan endo-1,3-beta-D-glucosidase n=1 Tax=Erythrobacter dokdonensis DSW-74 TaxID=1300349 RepID=A0A1A7BLW0_9SPHN|nr:glycoside hydrolase family 16 protein [Erythrobacter dokdonensis]OBV12145.1 Glucan endo-1,3-beta-D-glucosidase [Erythrobacter dokdonensis DSW-74]